MNVRIYSGLPAPVYHSPGSQGRFSTSSAPNSGSGGLTPSNDSAEGLVSLSPPARKILSGGTRLVGEQREHLENGYRRTQTFERADGRTFTRVEDVALTDRGVRRNVIQQNPSGTITRYEEVLDREDGGNFRRTQRFQDEAGEVSTQITADFKVTDPFVLSGGAAPAYAGASTPFQPMRGTQLDLHA